MVSFSVVSEIAIVPDSECRMPTLIVSSCAIAGEARLMPAAIAPADRNLVKDEKLPLIWISHWALHRNMRCNGCASWAGREIFGEFYA